MKKKQQIAIRNMVWSIGCVRVDLFWPVNPIHKFSPFIRQQNNHKLYGFDCWHNTTTTPNLNHFIIFHETKTTNTFHLICCYCFLVLCAPIGFFAVTNRSIYKKKQFLPFIKIQQNLLKALLKIVEFQKRLICVHLTNGTKRNRI